MSAFYGKHEEHEQLMRASVEVVEALGGGALDGIPVQTYNRRMVDDGYTREDAIRALQTHVEFGGLEFDKMFNIHMPSGA